MAKKQQVKVYDRGNINKAFQEDAERMARQGYRIASQSYGGTRPQSWFFRPSIAHANPKR